MWSPVRATFRLTVFRRGFEGARRLGAAGLRVARGTLRAFDVLFLFATAITPDKRYFKMN